MLNSSPKNPYGCDSCHIVLDCDAEDHCHHNAYRHYCTHLCDEIADGNVGGFAFHNLLNLAVETELCEYPLHRCEISAASAVIGRLNYSYIPVICVNRCTVPWANLLLAPALNLDRPKANRSLQSDF